MNPSNKFGSLLNDVKRSIAQKRHNTFSYFATKKANFLAQPVVAAVDTRLRYLVSHENIDNLKTRYDESYHWLAGTEVTEVQEQARFLESKLNVNRKEMREHREQLDNVVERLRSITSELEHTGRGDVKHLHLRQLEYETIQDEIKLGKMVQKSEYQERETFTLLMNAVRESHETERNYNQRIKMISLIGAIVGPFIGYLFSARLNAMRFARMEDIINKKLELLSFTTINAIREIHGMDPEVVSEPEKRGLIKRILELYQYTKTLLLDAYTVAVLRSSEFIEANFQQNDATEDGGSQLETIDRSVQITKPVMMDCSTQVSLADAPPTVEKVIIEKIISEAAPKVNYSELEEFKSLMSGLQTIENNQDELKRLLITSQELQDSNKIEVSVKASDEEIIEMLQSDQKKVRELLISIRNLVGKSQVSFDKSLGTLVGNVDSLSKKITNNSELYVANLEHSKIINDIAKSLMDIKANIDTIETYYINDVNKQFVELTKIHGDLSGQILHVRDDLISHKDTLLTINEHLLTADEHHQKTISKIDKMFEDLTVMLSEIKTDASVASVSDKIDQVSRTISDIKTAIGDVTSPSGDKMGTLQDNISQHIDRVMQKIEEAILTGKRFRSETVKSKDEILSNSKQNVSPVGDELGSVSPEWDGFPGATITLADANVELSNCEDIKHEYDLSTEEETTVVPDVASSKDEFIGFPGATDDERVISMGVAYTTFVIITTIIMLVYK